MINVLAIGPNVRGFKPGRGDRFLRVIKFRSTPNFRGAVKLSTPCHKILWHIKNLLVWTEILRKDELPFLSPISPVSYHMPLLAILPESSGGRARIFPKVTWSLHLGSPCSFIAAGWTVGPLMAAVQRRSLTHRRHHSQQDCVVHSYQNILGCSSGGSCVAVERRRR
jgi:hypothetical protein